MRNIRRTVMITLAAALFAVMAASSSFAGLTNNKYYNAPPKRASYLHTKPHAAAHHIVKAAPHKKNDFDNLNR